MNVHCILTSGGTGFAPRDLTAEATKSVINKECPQLSYLMLMEGLKYTSFAALSRAVCGIRGKTLIINFPGSEKAVKECFEAIANLIPHAIQLICDEKEKNEKKHGEIQKIPEVAKRAGEKQQKNHDNKTNKEKFHKNQKEIQKTQNKPQSAQKPPQKPPVTSKKPSVPVSELEELLKAQGIDFGREEQPVGPTKSEVEGFQEIINNLKPTPMTELVVDEVVKPMNVPKHVCPHKTGNLGDFYFFILKYKKPLNLTEKIFKI